jgi:hypothetical protein
VASSCPPPPPPPPAAGRRPGRGRPVVGVVVPPPPDGVFPGGPDPGCDPRLHAAQVDHEVEFVQVAVHEPVPREAPGERGALLAHAPRLLGRDPARVELVQGHAPHQPHRDHVTAVSDGFRSRISLVVQGPHERVFLRRRRPGEEQPGVGRGAVGRPAPPVLR